MMIDPLRKRILFIDDDANLLAVFERMARELAPHWNVVTARTLPEAMRMAPKADLIVLDLAFPGRDMDESIGAIPWLKAHAPVAVLTGKPLREAGRIERCLEAGASQVTSELQLLSNGWGLFIASCNSTIANN